MRSPRTSLNRLLLLAALVMLAFALGACRSKQQLVHTVTTTETSDKQSGVTLRDTNITVPGVKAQGSVPLPYTFSGLELPLHTVWSGRAWSSLSVSNGSIQHAGGCDTISFKATLYDRWSREQSSRAQTETKVEVITKEVRVIPKWVWWALAFGFAGLLRLLWPIIRRLIII